MAAVLELELDYMVAAGIAEATEYELQYYPPEDLAGAPNEVDPQLLAQDAQRVLRIPVEIAAGIFDAEFEFLKMRGLIHDGT